MIQSRGRVGPGCVNPLGRSSPGIQSTTKRCLFAGRSWARIVLLPIAVRLSGRLGTSFRPKSELIGIPQTGIDRHLLRETGDPQVSCRAQVVVRGRMKRSSETVLSSAVGLRKDSSNDNGRVCLSTGDAHRPHANFQNGLWTKSSSHHFRHLSRVWRLTPTIARS